MNADKLKELKERAERATQLAEEIEALQSANRFSHYLRFSKSYGDNSEILPKELLAELFDLGKAKLIEQKEAELSELLGETKPAYVPHRIHGVTPITLPDHPLIPLQLTGEEPKPFATIWCGERPLQDHLIGTLDSSDTWEQPAQIG